MKHAQLRVFVSSTFVDMHDERDLLVSRVFPQLRLRCEARGSTLSEIDLRWGIPEEEVAESGAFAACFEEIDLCRPLFVGLLAERYGWVPPTLPPGVLEQHPWLAEYAGRSITELEFRYGAFTAPSPSAPLLYLKRPTPGRTLDRKLAELRREIETGALPFRSYERASDLEAMVLDDLGRVLDGLLPRASPTNDAIARELEAQEAFCGRVAAVRPDVDLVGELTSAWKRKRRVLLVGPEGAGKTVALAAWVADPSGPRLRAPRRWPLGARRTAALLAHFVDATSDSRSPRTVLRSLLAQLGRVTGQALDPGNDTLAALAACLRDEIESASAAHDITIAIDGVEDLEEREEAHWLDFLPLESHSARLLLTMRLGEVANSLVRKGWFVVRLLPFSRCARKKLVADGLRQFGKRLSPGPLQEVADADPIGNPLFGKIFVNELRVMGDHTAIESDVGRLLECRDLEIAIGMGLSNWEKRLGSAAGRLLQATLRLLGTARMGLSEAELRDLLKDDHLGASDWHPIRAALAGFIVDHGGLYRMAHSSVRHAVAERYLQRDAKAAAHRKLIDYFTVQESPVRRLEELAYHCEALGAWRELGDLLSTPGFSELAWRLHPGALLRWWSSYRAATGRDSVDLLGRFVEQPGDAVEAAVSFGRVLLREGHAQHALALVDRAREALAGAMAQELSDLRVACLHALGRIPEALEELRSSARLWSETSRRGRAQLQVNEARLCYEAGDSRGALARMAARDRTTTTVEGEALLLEGVLERDAGHVREATRRFEESAAMFNRCGDKMGRAEALLALGAAWRDRGGYGRAEKAIEMAMALGRHMQSLDLERRGHLQLALNGMGQGRTDAAIDHLTVANRLVEQFDAPLPERLDLLEAWSALKWNSGLKQAAAQHITEALRLAHHAVPEARLRRLRQLAAKYLGG